MLELSTELGESKWISALAFVSISKSTNTDYSVVSLTDGSSSVLMIPAEELVGLIRKELASISRGINGLRVK